MPKGVKKEKTNKVGVRAVKGFITSEGKYSDDREIANFMEAASTVRKLVQQGAFKSAIDLLCNRAGGSKETYERDLSREIIRAAHTLSNVLRPIAKRVKSNAIAKSRLDEQSKEQNDALSQQRVLLDTDALINKYL